AKAGCGALRIDSRLVTSARRHSQDMAAKNYFDHTSQNGDSPWARMEAAGYPSPGAENIAKGYASPAAVMEGWMNSPGHRANIVNCELRTIGVGMAQGSGGPYWTQNFGF
ncbi:CAP domain-containing protein, partial [Actinomadura adrarensis]